MSYGFKEICQILEEYIYYNILKGCAIFTAAVKFGNIVRIFLPNELI